MQPARRLRLMVACVCCGYVGFFGLLITRLLGPDNARDWLSLVIPAAATVNLTVVLVRMFRRQRRVSAG